MLPFPFLPVSRSTAIGEINSGNRSGPGVKDGLDDVHLEAVHDAHHFISLLEVEDCSKGGELVAYPSLAFAHN